MNIADFIDLLVYGRDHADATAQVTVRIEGDEYDVTDTLNFETDHYVIDVTGVDETCERLRRGAEIAAALIKRPDVKR